MLQVRQVSLPNEDYKAHVFVICDTCKIEVDVKALWGLDNLYKEGWTYKFVYVYPSSTRYDYCPKCSLEHLHKIEGVD